MNFADIKASVVNAAASVKADVKRPMNFSYIKQGLAGASIGVLVALPLRLLMDEVGL